MLLSHGFLPDSLAVDIATLSSLLILLALALFLMFKKRPRGSTAEMLADAQQEAAEICRNARIEAREELLTLKQDFDQETQNARLRADQEREALLQRESELTRQWETLREREAEAQRERDRIEQVRQQAAATRSRLEQTVASQNDRLERIAGMTRDAARDLLLENMEKEARIQIARRVQTMKEEAERSARKESRRIVTMAVQRYAAEHTAETTVSVVELSDDDMKGRIIGREGRNIRSFEMITGVDVIIDDTPGAVILSAFNPIRREVARLSLEKLVQDGRIHPTRIEEIVELTRNELDERIMEIGEQSARDLGLQPLPVELQRQLGKLNYRTSYGQNVLAHSMEVAALCGMMAADLGLEEKVAKRAGLLHDIGKATDHDVEGTHAAIGGRLVERCGENPVVVNAVAGHHEEIESTHLITWLVSAADAISGSRPGARRENLETYIKRLENLEDLAADFPGVEKSYAIQAGREVRILVDSGELDDEQAVMLSHDIARKIENDLEYPGEIRVVVVRETRSVETAR